MKVSKFIHDDIVVNKPAQNVRENSPLLFSIPFWHVRRKCIEGWRIINPFHAKKVKCSSNDVAMDNKLKEVNCCIETTSYIFCNISPIQ